VHQWKYKEGERKEEMKERRKMERERKKKRPPSLSILFCIRHRKQSHRKGPVCTTIIDGTQADKNKKGKTATHAQ